MMDVNETDVLTAFLRDAKVSVFRYKWGVRVCRGFGVEASDNRQAFFCEDHPCFAAFASIADHLEVHKSEYPEMVKHRP